MAEPKDEIPERRFMIRYPSTGGATVVRDTDKMRSGLEAALHDVSTTGVGIHMEAMLEIGEQVKLRLRNDVQRFEKEVRGTVRHCTPIAGNRNLVGIELLTRLTPLEVSLLRMGIAGEPGDAKPRWI